VVAVVAVARRGGDVGVDVVGEQEDGSSLKVRSGVTMRLTRTCAPARLHLGMGTGVVVPEVVTANNRGPFFVHASY
jgi:hypothetical protein